MLLKTLGFACYDLDSIFKVFLERLVPYRLRYQMHDEFDHLEHESMTISKYEACFTLNLNIQPLGSSSILRGFKSL